MCLVCLAVELQYVQVPDSSCYKYTVPCAAVAVTQVCEAFVNVIIVREAVSAAVSLMAEVSLVYGRLLKQHRVLGWAPPKWDIAWWQQWAPAAVSSYATRTLLGAGALCPAAAPAGSPPAAGAGAVGQPGQERSAASSSSGAAPDSSGTSAAQAGAASSWLLSAEEVQRALHALASFDVVLDLGRPPLMDVSLAMLLGWSGQSYSTGQRKRSSQAAGVHTTWEQLELLARQLPPPLKDSLLLGGAATGSNGGGTKSGTGSRTSYLAGVDPSDAAAAVRATSAVSSASQAGAWQQEQRQQGSQEGGKPLSVAGDSSSTPSSTSVEAADLDAVRRLIGEVRVRQVYSSHGLSGVLLPFAPEVPLASPPAAVVAAAVAALSGAQHAPVSVQEVSDGAAGSSHLLVGLHVGAPGQPAAGTAALTAPVAGAAPGTAGEVGAGAGAEAAGDLVYHVWLRHGVVLDEQQYSQLLQATAADEQLYRFGRVMQALDAGWVSVLVQQRQVRKAMAQVQEEAGAACGFAGLNHLQS